MQGVVRCARDQTPPYLVKADFQHWTTREKSSQSLFPFELFNFVLVYRLTSAAIVSGELGEELSRTHHLHISLVSVVEVQFINIMHGL